MVSTPVPSSSFQGRLIHGHASAIAMHGPMPGGSGALCPQRSQKSSIGIPGSEPFLRWNRRKNGNNWFPKRCYDAECRILEPMLFPKKNSQAAGFVLMEFLQNPVIVRVFLFSVFSDFHVF
ncbi:MAG: hypothetical protein ACLSFJ_07540 [Holdemania filiformis]